MSGTESTKICGVCGDKAIARNFCALTCESCKAFFRRNASKINELKCIYGDDCPINLDTRKRCRKCRLKRCLKVGMRKEWILNEEEKRVRNTKIEENRKKKVNNEITSNISLPLSDTNSSAILQVSDVSNEYPINTQTNEYSIDFENSLEYSSDHSSEYSSELVPIVRPLTDYYNNFTENEGKVLNDLLSATRLFRYLIPGITSEVKIISEAMEVVTNIWDEEIRTLIKAVKSLTPFKIICKSDQISLMKCAAVEVAFMRSITSYDVSNQYWIIPKDDNNSIKLELEVLKQDPFDHYIECKWVINKLALIWDMDHIILHLLMAIILFNPTRPQLTHRAQVRLQQQIYMHLLKRYLLLKYRSEKESESRFAKLMEVITDLHEYHEKHIKRFLMEMPPNYVFFSKPLLRELYDRK